MPEFFVNPDPSMTTLVVAQANALDGFQKIVVHMNEQAAVLYKFGFQNWAISVQAGRPDGSPPPEPPMEQVVKVGSDGWPYAERGTELVCDMPPFPSEALRTKGLVRIGIRIGAGIYRVMPDDTAAEGTHATAPDGTPVVRTVVFMGSYYLAG